MTPDEIQQRIEELRTQFFANEIDADAFQKQLKELEQQKLQVQFAIQQDPLLGVQLQRDFEQRQQPKKVIQVPSQREYIPPKYGPRSEAEVYAAQQKFVGDKTRYYMDELGFDQEEAVEQAINDANKKIKPPTPKFQPLSNLFLSDIVDVELGIVRNKDGTLRKAGQLELAYESLFRQPIGAAPGVKKTIAEEALRLKQEEERRKKLPASLTFSQDLERKTKDIATGAARTLFTETQLDKGLIYESGLAAGLRSGTMVPPAIVAAGISQGIDPKETDAYRKADSAEFADQVIVNIAKGQGLPQVAMATFPESPNAAFAVGLIPELFMPLTGIPFAVGTLAKGARVAAKGTANLGSSVVPNLLYSASAPIEAIKRSTTAAQVDLLFDQLNTGKTSKQVLNEAYKDMSWEAVLNKEIPRQTLRGVAAKELADRGAGLSILDSVLKTDVPVTAGELRALNNTTITGFVTDLDDATTVTRSNLGVNLANELAQWERVVAGNKDWTKIYNQNLAAKKTVEEILQAQKTGQSLGRARTTVLTRPFLDQLNRGRVADLVKDLSPAEAKPILKIELAQSIDEVLTKTDDLDLTTMTNAFQRTLEDAYNENLLNLVPEDLLVLSKGIIVPTKQFTNKTKRNKYFEDLKSKQEQLDFKDNVVDVNDNFKNELIEMVIDYAGVATIRDSTMYQDFIKQTIDGSFDAKYFDLFVRPAIIKKVASDNFDVRRLQTAGKQFEEASVPLELRGDVLAISAGQDLETQLYKGSIGDAIRTVKTFAKATKASKAKSPTMAPQVGFKISPEFVTLEKEINQQVDNLVDVFTNDLKAELASGKSIEEAFNKFMLEAYDQSMEEPLRFVTDTVNRAFNSNYEQYAKQFLPDRVSYIERNVAEMVEQLEVPITPEIYKDIYEFAVIDDVLYLATLDQWNSILRTSFGADFVLKADDTNLVLELIRKGKRSEKTLRFESRQSVVLPPTLSNIIRVQDRVEQVFPDLKRLKTPSVLGKGDDVTLVIAQEYILGMRQSRMVQDNINNFLNTNPQYRQDLLPDYIGTNQQIDLIPLTEKYKSILEDVFVTANAANVPEVTMGLAQELSRLHVQSLLSSIASQRDKIDTWVSSVWGGKNIGQETLRADLSTAANQLNDIIQPSVLPIQERAVGIMNRLNRTLETRLTTEQQQQVVKQLQEEIAELFRDGLATDDVVFSNPIFGITEDILQQSRDFYRSNGIAVGDKIVAALDQNQPLFQQFLGQNSRLAYAQGENNVIREMVQNLNKMATNSKLRSTLEQLQKVQSGGKSEYAKYAIDQVLQMARASLSQGLLAGTYGPNLRYLGQNVFTAPIIMMGTIGAGRTVRSILTRGLSSLRTGVGNLGENASFLFLGKAKSIFSRNGNNVVFTSKSGRKYTAKELIDLESKYNIGLSRNQVELYRGTVKNQMSRLGFTLEGNKRGLAKKGIDLLLNPTQRGLYSQLADGTDTLYRRSVFYSALADDLPLNQAVDLAKRSLLDYGAIGKQERDYFRRYVLFWSFTRQITSEFINAMAKGVAGGSHNFILRAARASMQQQQAAGSWLYSDDPLKSRMYSMWKGKIDNKDVWTFGFSNPYVETFETLMSMPFYAYDISKFKFLSVAEQIIKSYARGGRPLMQFALGLLQEDYEKGVPADEVALMKATGCWPIYKQFFEIRRLETKEKKRRTDPLFVDRYGNQVQYKMSSNGAKWYAGMQLASLLIGLNRLPKDLAKRMMAAQEQKVVQTEDFTSIEDYGRFGTPNPVLFLLGAETSVPVNTENEIVFKAMKDLERALKKQ